MSAVVVPSNEREAKAFARKLLRDFLDQGYKPDGLHCWRDADGQESFRTARCKHPDGRKEIRPFYRDATGWRAGKPPKPPGGWVPYGAHTLTPDGPVLVVEGERCADALHALGLAAVTSGSATSCRDADWTALAGREVVLWPDHDEPGQRYACDVAEALRALGCVVSVIDVEALGLEPKGDAVDWRDQHKDATAADVLALKRVADVAVSRALTSRAVRVPLVGLPLTEALERAAGLLSAADNEGSDDYPIEALGPLAEAAAELAAGMQVQPAMAGQSLLAVAALLTQAVANVQSLDGSVKPLSLYCLTVALSGDGKDAADRVALKSVHDWQRAEAKAYTHERAEFDGLSRIEQADKPLRAAPFRLAADFTIEGLRRSFTEGVPSQGLFSTEAGAVLAGHAMTPEQRTKTAATLCGLFDRGHLSVVRAGAGRIERYGLRLSAHLLVQPTAVVEVLHDPGLAGVGFWPRFLLAWPPPLPPRKFRPWSPEDSPAIRAYWARCAELLDAHLPEDCDTLPALPLSDGAVKGMAALFEAMEHEARRGELQPVRPFALRATELACRVAGVLAVFAGREVVTAEDAKGACLLVTHAVTGWRRALTERTNPAVQRALDLYEWLLVRPDGVSGRDILRLGPPQARTVPGRDEALARLQAAGLANITDGHAVALERPEGVRR